MTWDGSYDIMKCKNQENALHENHTSCKVNGLYFYDLSRTVFKKLFSH